MTDPRRTGVFDLLTEPELEELFQMALQNFRVSLRTSTIGKVVATDVQPQGFDPVKQLVSVEVQIPLISRDPKDPSKTIQAAPIIVKNIPVSYPRSLGGHWLTFPIGVGDTGELVIQDRDPRKWFGSGNIVDPVSRYTLNLAHGVFHPGLCTESNRIPAFDTTALVVESPSIKVGKDAIQPAVLGDDLLSKLNELINVFNQHTHIYTPPIPAAAAATAPTATPLPQQSTVVPSDFQSLKVKVE